MATPISRAPALLHPVAALVFVTCIFAEANRTPFDLAECESELVGGYHTEYSSMKFALFFLGEYGSMITGSAVAIALFFGGWNIPWIDHIPAIHNLTQPVAGWGGVVFKLACYSFKIVLFTFFYMWIRWTLPRFRFDQLMRLAWRGLVPISLGSFAIAIIGVYLRVLNPSFHLSLFLGAANIVFFILILFALKSMPPSTSNIRMPVAGSRYNPVLAVR